MEMNMIAIEPIAKTWTAFRASSGIGHIRSEAQYERIMDLMDELADLGAMDESSELHELFMLAADVVRQYESLHYPDPKVSGVEMLRFLMGQHGLKQTDLIQELGSQSIVSAILSGRRELNKGHIAALSKRFKVSPAVFFD
jgi:HTH-type transcriptional regulator/antitoxin HigA